jgi:hypothetical protein
MLKLGTATFTVVAKPVDGSRRQNSRKQHRTSFIIYLFSRFEAFAADWAD